jgi:hypothetical protein
MIKTKAILVMLILMISVVLYGTAGDSPAPSKVTVVKGNGLVKVIYVGDHPDHVKVTILDDHGKKIFSEQIKEDDGFIRPYDFSELPDGDYTVTVSDGDIQFEEKIEHREEEQLRLLAHVTKIDSGEDRYLLSVPGKGEQEITIKLYNDQFNLLYEGKERIVNGFAQVYNIKNLGLQEIISFEVSNDEGASVTVQPK